MCWKYDTLATIKIHEFRRYTVMDNNKINRTADMEDFGYHTRQGKALFTYEQIMDVLALIRADELPNGDFSDDEVSLYFDLKNRARIKF